MKPATLQSYRAIAAAIALVLLTGVASMTHAGNGKRVVRTRHTEQTQVIIRDTGTNSTPLPVADERPIDPERFNNNHSTITPDSDSNRTPLRRTTVRRR